MGERSELALPPVLVAPDSFKGTLSATDVTAALCAGFEAGGRATDPCPLADGGEGTLVALTAGDPTSELVDVQVHDPLGRPLTAQFALTQGGRTAVVETAAAIGLGLVEEDQRDPEALSSAGAGELIRAHGLALSGYCRGGMFPAIDAAARRAALDDNFRAVDEAAALGSPCLVLVVGGLPGALDGVPAHRDLGRARGEVRDGVAALLEYAREAAMPLAIEPLHPMYAADRSCVNTLEQALDLCDAVDPG
ncbi:MAG: glycerate kinase, partial [Actinomycetes bacterium]